jgi:hypothetical protein
MNFTIIYGGIMKTSIQRMKPAGRLHLSAVCAGVSCIVLAFASCGVDDKGRTISVENKSSFPVEYTLRVTSSEKKNYSLEIGESITEFFQYMPGMDVYSPSNRVTSDRSDVHAWVFRDLPSYTVSVINTLGVAVTLKETGGFMEDISVPAAKANAENSIIEGSGSGVVYTSSPVFLATRADKYPVEIQTVYNAGAKTYYLAIR